MIGLLMKLIICPLAVIISDFLFRSVYYTNISQAIIVGIILAILAHMMEVFILKNDTFRTSNVLDFIAAFLIVYLTQFLFTGAVVTFMGALLTSALLLVTEYFQHRYLIRTGRTRKA